MVGLGGTREAWDKAFLKALPDSGDLEIKFSRTLRVTGCVCIILKPIFSGFPRKQQGVPHFRFMFEGAPGIKS